MDRSNFAIGPHPDKLLTAQSLRFGVNSLRHPLPTISFRTLRHALSISVSLILPILLSTLAHADTIKAKTLPCALTENEAIALEVDPAGNVHALADYKENNIGHAQSAKIRATGLSRGQCARP